MLLTVHKTKIKVAGVLLVAISIVFFYVDITRLNIPYREESSNTPTKGSTSQRVVQSNNDYFKPNQYSLAQKVPLFFDKIKSSKKPNLKSIPYYDLPFTCSLSEDDDEEEYRPVHYSLMDVLTFKRLWASPVAMQFGYNKHCQVICERKIDSNTVDKLTSWIDQEYQHYWYIDDNLAGSSVDTKKKYKQAGFPIGYRDKNRDYYLNTHFSFVIKYENNSFSDNTSNEYITQNSANDNHVIVGFEVEPISLDSYKCPTYSTDYNKFKLVKRDQEDVIPYTFSVTWQQVEKTNGKSSYLARWSDILALDKSKQFSKGSMELVLCCSVISAYVLFMLAYCYYQSISENKKICLKITHALSSSHHYRGSDIQTVFHKFSFLFGLQCFALLVAGVIILSSLFKRNTISYRILCSMTILLAGGSAASSWLGTLMSNISSPSEKPFAKKKNDKFIIWESFVYGISMPLVLTVTTELLVCFVDLFDQPEFVTLPFVRKFYLRYLLTGVVICFLVGLFCKSSVGKNRPIFIMRKAQLFAHDHDKIFNQTGLIKGKNDYKDQEFELKNAGSENFVINTLKTFSLWCLSGLVKFLFCYAFFQVLFVGKQTFSSVDQTSYFELIAKTFFMFFIMFVVSSSTNTMVLLWGLQRNKDQSYWKIVNFFMTYSSFPFGLAYAIHYALQVAQVTDVASITFHLFYAGFVMNICFHSALYFLSSLVNMEVLKRVENSTVDEYTRYEEA